MFLNKLFGPQIVFGSSGGGSGGGGSSRSSSRGRNRDADMAAGSRYAPTKNAGTSRARQVTYTGGSNGPSRTTRSIGGGGKGSSRSLNSPTSVSAKDLKSGNVSTYKNKTGGGSVTVSRGTALKDVPQVGSKPNSEVYSSKDVATPPPMAPVSSGSNAPVTAPELIDPADGVGGGRDGGGSAKRKASKTQEDNIAITRAAEGVDGYKRKRSDKSKAAENPMSIRKT